MDAKQKLKRAKANFDKVARSPMARTIGGLPEALESLSDMVVILNAQADWLVKVQARFIDCKPCKSDQCDCEFPECDCFAEETS